MLNREDCLNWILTGCKEVNESFPGRQPDTVEGIKTAVFNGNSFYHVRSHTEKDWTAFYEIPISDDHLLSFYFRPSGGHKYLVNDENNVEAEAEKMIQSFMENLHITLSPDTQKRIEELEQNEQVR